MEVTCAKCNKKKERDLSEYTNKMFYIRNLQVAGYPFGKNDLTVEEWEDLGKLKDVIR